MTQVDNEMIVLSQTCGESSHMYTVAVCYTFIITVSELIGQLHVMFSNITMISNTLQKSKDFLKKKIVKTKCC